MLSEVLQQQALSSFKRRRHRLLAVIAFVMEGRHVTVSRYSLNITETYSHVLITEILMKIRLQMSPNLAAVLLFS